MLYLVLDEADVIKILHIEYDAVYGEVSPTYFRAVTIHMYIQSHTREHMC